IFEYRDKFPKRDLAYSVEEYIARGFAELAIEIAEKEGTKYIGFSGGCAYNDHLLSTIKKIVEKRNFIFLQHEKVPPGDGGISLGQAVVAANSI
ncbi:MAG: carbamoyltransferase HypF, partial [Thermoplasmata archaeon]